MLVKVRSNGAAGPDDFGDITNGLTNGLTIKVMDSGDSEVVDLLRGRTITNNGEWGEHCYDVRNIGDGFSGDDMWIARWTFERAGSPLYFPAGHDYRFECVVSDDLSSLVRVHIGLQGYYL